MMLRIAGGLFVSQSSVFRINEKLHNGKQGFALTKKQRLHNDEATGKYLNQRNEKIWI